MNYLLTASVLLLVIWPAYALLLRYSSRYTFNRYVLLLAIGVTLALPALEFTSPLPEISRSVQTSIHSVESSVYLSNPVTARPQVQGAGEESQGTVAPVETATAIPATDRVSINYWLLAYLFGLGSVGLLLFIRLYKLARLHVHASRSGGFYQLPEYAGSGQAFTFGRRIYLSRDLIYSNDFDHILSHEEVHARQLHSVDILASECFLCIFWFHPVAWWLRTKLRANLEYLVDNEVATDDLARKRSYQLALVRQSQGVQTLALTLPFSEPTLHSRIARLTGMREYRVATWFAGIGLLIWFTAAALVIEGKFFDQPPAGNEYLAASAGPDDPYVKFYDVLLPEDLETFELYTDRMLTGDEYLRVRAILAKVPGAKLYVYKNAADQGPSLQLVRHYELPATVSALPVNGGDHAFMLGLEKRADLFATTQYNVISTQFGEHQNEGSGNNVVAVHLNGQLSSPSVENLDVLGHDYSQGPLVFFNKQRVDLRAGALSSTLQPSQYYTVNNIDARELSGGEWTKITVEDRPIRSPSERMAELLGHRIESYGKDVRDLLWVEGTAYGYQHFVNGTFRSWYDDLYLPEDHPCACYYNDRRVDLDFLLDREFGPNAMIHVHHRMDKQGRVTLQVLDDYPDIYAANAHNSGPITRLDNHTHTLKIFLKRMPGTNEIEFIRQYLDEFPGYELRLYQTCSDQPGLEGTYTLNLGKENEEPNGFTGFKLGTQYDHPRKLELTRSGPAGLYGTVYGGGDIGWPAKATDSDVVLELNGEVIPAPSLPNTIYDLAKLDEPIAFESLRCKMLADPAADQIRNFYQEVNRSGNFDQLADSLGVLTNWKLAQEWVYTYRDTGPEMMEHLLKTRDAHDFTARPMLLYINDDPVELEEFMEYQTGPDSYVQMGTYPGVEDAALHLQLIDPGK